MKLLTAFALALATLFAAMTIAHAVSFDERWKSLFGVSEVITEAVSAKAELVRTKEIKKPTRHARRHYARRHSARRGKVVRVREWYKGGKKWHYVYKRRR